MDGIGKQSSLFGTVLKIIVAALAILFGFAILSDYIEQSAEYRDARGELHDSYERLGDEVERMRDRTEELSGKGEDRRWIIIVEKSK